MAFGMSAASAALVGSIAAPVVGGLLGGSNSGSSQSSTRELDPRIAKYVYGANGDGGLLADANNLYRQQFAQGGLNPMQTGGLEMQRQVLTSPQFTQGYDAMRSLGMGLMSGGVAGNPFTGGSTAKPNTETKYNPFSFSAANVPTSVVNAVTTPIQQALAPEKSTTQQEDVMSIVDAYMKANKMGKYAVTYDDPYDNRSGGGA